MTVDVDVDAYLNGVVARMSAPSFNEVEGSSPTVRWFRERGAHLEWFLAPLDHVDVGGLQAFLDNCVARSVEHRRKAAEVLSLGQEETVCAVVITRHAPQDVLNFVTEYHPKRKQSMSWGRLPFPVVVDLDVGSVTCPEGRPRLLSVGSMPIRASLKLATREAKRLLTPGGSPA